jgi:hypothetical protein
MFAAALVAPLSIREPSLNPVIFYDAVPKAPKATGDDYRPVIVHLARPFGESHIFLALLIV